eukprot:6202717-Pleurochrysis_carterae.AAC.2
MTHDSCYQLCPYGITVRSMAYMDMGQANGSAQHICRNWCCISGLDKCEVLKGRGRCGCYSRTGCTQTLAQGPCKK